MWATFWNHFWTPLKNGSGHFFMIFGVPKWVQKGEFISVLGGHGAPWAPKSVLGPESCISRPPKVTPRSDNRLKKGANVAEKLVPNLARRTARSGLNWNLHVDQIQDLCLIAFPLHSQTAFAMLLESWVACQAQECDEFSETPSIHRDSFQKIYRLNCYHRRARR